MKMYRMKIQTNTEIDASMIDESEPIIITQFKKDGDINYIYGIAYDKKKFKKIIRPILVKNECTFKYESIKTIVKDVGGFNQGIALIMISTTDRGYGTNNNVIIPDNFKWDGFFVTDKEEV